MKYCSVCKKEQATGDFCTNCGQRLIDKIEQPVSQEIPVSFCGKCGTKIEGNLTACPNCGADLQAASVGREPVQPLRQTNPIIQKVINCGKDFLVSPMHAADMTLRDNSPVMGLIASGILFVSSLVFWLCFAGKIQLTIGISDFFLLGIVFSILNTVALILTPTLSCFIASIIDKQRKMFIGIFNTCAWTSLFIAPFLLLGGLFIFVSFNSFFITSIVALGIYIFTSVSLTNHILNNCFHSPKTFWITFILFMGIGCIFTLIFSAICRGSAEDVLYSIISSVLM